MARTALARHFADFRFELSDQVQLPDAFLHRKSGDCADFANLASQVLTQRGYTTKLVVVMMAKQTHVVCYVKESGGFLDYNHRADAHPVVESGGALEEIAAKVSADFRSEWRLASQFRYRGVWPVYLETAFPIDASLAGGAGLAPKPAKCLAAAPQVAVSAKPMPLAMEAEMIGPIR